MNINEELDEIEQLIDEAIEAKANAAKARAQNPQRPETTFEREFIDRAWKAGRQAYRGLNRIQKWVTDNGTDPARSRRHELGRRLLDEVFELPEELRD